MPSRAGRPLDEVSLLVGRGTECATRTRDAFTRTDLELPLGGHDLRINAGNLDTGEQTSLVVGLDDISAIDFCGSNTAVVGSLRSWEASTRPAVWPAIGAK